MVDWFAGKRVRGTSSERSGFGTSLGGTGVGGWVELGRTTLGSSSDTITVSSLADKRYYMVLWNIIPTGAVYHEARLNGDTGNNYASRYSTDGGSDGTSINQPILSNGVAGGSTPAFHVGYWANKSNKEKLGITHSVGQSTAGSSTAPIRREIVGKWANTSNPINQFQAYNSNTGDYNTNSEVVVLGYDPADTHSSNFWEELASVNPSSASQTIDTGTFTAKKYLHFQFFADGNANNATTINFNSDSGNNYARRRSYNGSEFSQGSNPTIYAYASTGARPVYMTGFIINNASNEKLVMFWINENITAGASTAPDRVEFTAKWANTSSQITKIVLDGGTASCYGTNSWLKVWGAD